MITKAQILDHDRACEAGKIQWGEGPWTEEPNRVEFLAHGFNCLLLRVPHSGHWCGYVGLPKTHPSFAKHYDDVGVDVHGGLTYAEHCSGNVCHITEGPDELYWLGFDCVHSGDLSPMTAAYFKKDPANTSAIRARLHMDETYKTVAWVKRETENLAKQLKEIG